MHRDMIRKQFVYERDGLVMLLCLLMLAAMAARTDAIEHGKPVGEPYQPLGKRLVFTTWYFVRPGQLDWVDAEGKSVYASKAVKHGPFDAQFKLYDAPRGIRIIAQPARRVGPIISVEPPWENVSVSTVIHEDGKYRLWGGCQDSNGRAYKCYFESEDGRNWRRPSLGLVQIDGSRENNLLPLNIGTVFKDPNATPEERYKSVWHGDFDPKRFADYKHRRPWSVLATESDPGRVHSICAAISPDGIHWKELEDSISVEASDTQVVAHFDERLRKYVMYTRNYMIGPRADEFPNPVARRHQFLGRRSIGRSESSNFREFPLSEVIIEPGCDMSPTDTYYTNCYTAIPGSPDHHLLFPAVYHQDRDTTSIELRASYDGKIWHRVPGSPVLKTAEFGAWDGGCIFTCPNLVELPNGDWALPYTGYVYPHKYPRGAWKYDVGLAIWPKGRLVALEAAEAGELTTAAMVAPGTRLRINAVTERAGSILVEAANLEGTPIPERSFGDAVPLIGDLFWTPVTWKGQEDLGVKEGEPVELRLRLNKAKVYGLQFE
ncbi:MAG: hypothetical protein JSV03_10080 [Planctomycetota bacterium]|nr:MAG: hypothetical protein JSV03_10080 [Planctomycetota bacterium]